MAYLSASLAFKFITIGEKNSISSLFYQLFPQNIPQNLFFPIAEVRYRRVVVVTADLIT